MNMMFFCLDTKRELKNQEPNMLPTRTPGHPRIWLGPTRRHGIKFCKRISDLARPKWLALYRRDVLESSVQFMPNKKWLPHQQPLFCNNRC